MSKFTDEQIKFLEQAIELKTVDGKIRIRNVYNDIDGFVLGNVRADVRGNVGGSVGGNVEGSVEGSVGGNVWGKVYGTIQGWSAWKYFLEFLKLQT